MADILAHAEGTQESRIERCIALGSILSEVLEAEQCFALKDLQINGRDIMNLGIEQGKRVGEILNSLLDEVISGALENEHNTLMQRAWSFLAEPKYPESRECYFLYELVDGELKKLGKARTPKEL